MSKLVSICSEINEVVAIKDHALRVYQADGSEIKIMGVDPNGDVDVFLRERVTSGFPVITTDHGFIHEGIAFTLAGTASVGGASTFSISFETPADKYIHFKPTGVAASGGPVTISLLEGATYTGGSGATPRNRNRTITTPDSSTVTAKTGVSATGGTSISVLYIPSSTQGNQKLGASSAAAEEYVLDRSTTYILSFANAALSAITIGYDLFWYEEEAA